MANSINRWVGSGTFGADPEWIGDNQAGCRFSIASSEAFKKKDSDDWEEHTNWLDCVAWGKVANPIMRHMVKGSKVIIDGRLKQERWEKDGQKRSAVRIYVQNIEFMPKAGAGGSKGSSGSDDSGSAPEDDDDIPF